MNVFLYTIASFWKFIFKNDFNSKLIWEDLLFKFSYRYNDKDKTSYKIFFVFLKQALSLIYAKPLKNFDSKSHHLIFDISSGAQKDRIDYLLPFINNDSYCFQAKQELRLNKSFLTRFWYTILTLKVFSFSLILSLFYRNKANLALLSLEFVELLLLSDCVKKSQIKNMFFFSAYEKDTCYISDYLIRKCSITVQLIPSPNPISNFYQRVICSVFTFTVPYQKVEFAKLQHNWSVVKTVQWPPAGYKHLLKTLDRQTMKRTVGFISSGNWLRKKMGHNDLGKGVFNAEMKIIEFLKQFLITNNDVKLIISLHPIEKKQIEQTTIFYNVEFKNIDFEFFPFDKATRDFPEKFDVAVATYSSAMFERLFSGYKVMFSQDGMPENYFNDHRLLDITANNSEQFSKLLNKIFDLTNDEYFNLFKINDYSHTAFSDLKL